MTDTTQPSGSVREPGASRVGAIGLGQMGHALATDLVADGYLVSVHDQDLKPTAAVVGATAVAW
jgi:3-hydroxyisobutyrate dehydrogenase-like beta-hydroxyacid dehydrogenase